MDISSPSATTANNISNNTMTNTNTNNSNDADVATAAGNSIIPMDDIVAVDFSSQAHDLLLNNNNHQRRNVIFPGVHHHDANADDARCVGITRHHTAAHLPANPATITTHPEKERPTTAAPADRRPAGFNSTYSKNNKTGEEQHAQPPHQPHMQHHHRHQQQQQPQQRDPPTGATTLPSSPPPASDRTLISRDNMLVLAHEFGSRELADLPSPRKVGDVLKCMLQTGWFVPEVDFAVSPATGQLDPSKTHSLWKAVVMPQSVSARDVANLFFEFDPTVTANTNTTSNANNADDGGPSFKGAAADELFTTDEEDNGGDRWGPFETTESIVRRAHRRSQMRKLRARLFTEAGRKLPLTTIRMLQAKAASRISDVALRRERVGAMLEHTAARVRREVLESQVLSHQQRQQQQQLQQAQAQAHLVETLRSDGGNNPNHKQGVQYHHRHHNHQQQRHRHSSPQQHNHHGRRRRLRKRPASLSLGAEGKRHSAADLDGDNDMVVVSSADEWGCEKRMRTTSEEDKPVHC